MKYFFFLFFTIFYINSFAQKKVQLEYDNTPLEIILKTLEDSYNIKFSFNADLLKKKNVTIKENNTLEYILKIIEAQAPLVFEKINDRYYAIRNKQKVVRLCGYLINSEKKPISEAYIYNKSQSNSVISDSKGYFELHLPKPNDTIDIKFLGYKSKKLIAKELIGDGCKEIILIENDVELGEVLITEYITSGISRVGVSSAISINPSELGILPRLAEPDILQSLQSLPGIQSPTETAAGLHIRGGTPDQNLILWDGIKMYSTGHFFDLLSVFNPYITENIELYRSSTEAKYGNRISGVIDIRSKDEVVDNFGIGFGFNMTNADIFIEAPISKNLSFIISGRRSFTDFLETTTFRSYSDRAFQSIRFFVDDEELDQEMTENENIFFFNDLTLKMILKASENDKLTISSIFTNNELDYSLNIIGILGFGEPFDEIQKDRLKYVNQGINTQWSKNWNDRFSHSISLYYSNYKFGYRGLRESRATRDGFLFYQDNIAENNEIRDVGASVHTDWKINDNHSVVSGYDFSTNMVSYNADYSASEYYENESSNNITHAAFGAYKYNLNEKLKISIGLRANHFSVLDKLYLEPRINLEATILKGVTTKVSVERKNQVISQISNYLPFDFNIDNQIWLLADSDLVSVLSNDELSAGFILKKNSWYIDVEGYYKDIKGITSFSNGFNGVLDLTTGKSKTVGLDILIQKRIQNYRTWVSYSITDQNLTFQDINDGIPFPGNFDISHNISWAHSYQWNNFEVSLGWNMRTGRPFTPATGVVEDDFFVLIDYGEVNSKRLDNYHRLDFSSTYKFNLSKNEKWKGKIGLSLFNVYDTKNTLNRIYDIRYDNNNDRYLLKELNTFSAGITPNLSLRITF